jgi:hypothetical protein
MISIGKLFLACEYKITLIIHIENGKTKRFTGYNGVRRTNGFNSILKQATAA